MPEKKDPEKRGDVQTEKAQNDPELSRAPKRPASEKDKAQKNSNR